MTNSARAVPGALPDKGQQKAQGTNWNDLDQEDGVEDTPFKTLTREEAQALREKHPPVSPWRVVAAQAVTGVAIALLWWFFTGAGNKVGSALGGAAAVVIPNALMAWGISRLFSELPSAAALGFMVWELIKIMLTVAILGAVVKWMPDLSWPALLVALIGCLKVNWLALLWQGRMKRDGN